MRVALWGARLHVLSLLSRNVTDDIIGNTADNLLFETNLAQWLAANRTSPCRCWWVPHRR